MSQAQTILVVGRSGRLARTLVEEAGRLGVAVRAIGRPDLDITKPDLVQRVVAAEGPSAIINAAGVVIMDEAERDPERAFAVNSEGAGCLAEVANDAGIAFVHISTDYVFDGNKSTPYVEDDPTGAISVYGHSKAVGEQAVLAKYPSAIVARTSYVFFPFASNFLTAMLRLAETQDTVRVVADQFGTPTSAVDLAQALLLIAGRLQQDRDRFPGGIYHVAGRGTASWLHFAEAIFAGWARRGHKVPRVEPTSLADWPGPAKRPRYSPLDCSKVERTFGIMLPPWEQSLEMCLDRIARDQGKAQP
jgi:dTDP-4-dehydrorhamnose reductase